MSLKKFFNNLREIEVDLAWCHWNRLGVSGRGSVNNCSTDPEALIVLTSIVGKYDLRLADVMSEWLANYESLVSIERMKRYIKELQTKKEVPDNIFDILRKTLSHVNAKRWQSISDLIEAGQQKNISANDRNPSRRKLEDHSRIIKDNRQLFLRLMFGVGSRADIIYYAGVVCNQKKTSGLQISAPHITRMLHYNNSTIFRTLCDLEQAGVLVIDPKTTGGKNKVYLPNMQFKGATDIFGAGKNGENVFVDWFAIAKICALIEPLENTLLEVNEESIVKSRLNDFATSCSILMSDACVEVKDTLSMKALHPALIHVGMDELQSKVISRIGGMYEFVCDG